MLAAPSEQCNSRLVPLNAITFCRFQCNWSLNNNYTKVCAAPMEQFSLVINFFYKAFCPAGANEMKSDIRGISKTFFALLGVLPIVSEHY